MVLGAPEANIVKMHAYRDAIRDDDGHHVVRYAAILYPGVTERYPQSAASPSVEALYAYPGDDEPLRQHLRTVLWPALAGRDSHDEPL